MEQELYDVIAVNIESKKERVLAVGKTRKNADAIVNMAVARRGVEEEFFKKVPHKE
jgi:hypothetical protein